MSKFVESFLIKSDYQIAFNDPNSNWDIYLNSEGRALSIAKVRGCESTFFGDIHHIHKLMANNLFNSEIKHITEYGRECLQGMYSKLFTDSKGSQFSIVRLK